jgi:hypothetical protein
LPTSSASNATSMALTVMMIRLRVRHTGR